jgi:hypothetical protein
VTLAHVLNAAKGHFPIYPLKFQPGMPMNSVTEQEQLLMFARWRHWAAVGAVFAGLACGVLAAPGYLPVIGPVPLRYRPAAQPATNLVFIPLPPPDPPSTPPDLAPAPPARPAAADTDTRKTPPAEPAPSATLTNMVSSDPAGQNGVSSASAPLISPQMLLRYFNRPTNGATGGIIAPVDFAPPAPATRPSSTATYSTDSK